MAAELIRLKDLVMEFGNERVLDSINLTIEDKKYRLSELRTVPAFRCVR